MVFTSVSWEKVDRGPEGTWKVTDPQTVSFAQLLQSLEPDQSHESDRDAN
jgi:hypothetical protein